MQRRRFIVKAGGVLAAVGTATTVDAPNVIAQPSIRWRLSTAWTSALEFHQGAADRLATFVHEATGGRFRIDVFPGGQIIQPFACFDATSQGTIEAFGAVSSYWTSTGKDPAFEWFMTIPFGMNPAGMVAWYHQGDGLKLWEETYAAYNLVPRPGPALAPQMAGWFRKKINAISDYKGIKMRIAGLGGKVITRAGGSAVVTPPAEIYAALERGVIDASEWVCPHDDLKLGLHNTARYYYYPGWHEPGTTLEFGFNKKAYESLPADFRRTLDHAATATQVHGLTEFHVKNATALARINTELKGKVEVLPLPAAVLRDLRKLSADVVHDESEKSPMARRVHASFAKFQKHLAGWSRLSEGAHYQSIAL